MAKQGWMPTIRQQRTPGSGQASNDRLAAALQASTYRERVDEIIRGEWSDIDWDFLCFSQPYELLAELIPLQWTVLDVGCAFAIQSWWFRDHYRYIGVDPSTPITDRLMMDNSLHLQLAAHQLNDVRHVTTSSTPIFAICNAVPDDSASEFVRAYYQHVFVKYP